MEIGRRRFALAAVTAGASALAGCAALGAGDDSPEPVTATEPNDDGKGTLGELRYLIENEQASIDGDVAIPLTRMVHGSGDGFTFVRATYDSSASDLNEFVNEVAVFARSYAIYVDAGDDAVTDFTVQVADRYPGQPTSFGIRRTWARSFNADETSANEYLNTVAQTFTYPTTTSDGSTNGTTTTTGTTATNTTGGANE